MKDVKGLPLTGTIAFRLGVLGATANAAVAERFEKHALTLKHVGLLAVLDEGGGASQQEIAQRMRVAPSLVVTLADQLAGLGAIVRERDPRDRRRQVLSLTGDGRALLKSCVAAAHAVDAELTAALTREQREGLRTALRILAGGNGFPVPEESRVD
ncbi:MarR family transcriptional regulator [Amycolatopsis cynarae]|uniref:MarR family transcriptional regulator n=1 Tax=Amycolatopsis cynarae TaxID=2995223 RepID=A0ABY7ATG7_9PSEU|nr:MarR family transcriptional regulator [Amycolatopsis sp. HUAS 11-8]WAL62975.1 MarR family transcriptional regulator [Amycolatopsis sp. HUAS 11-8]